MGELEELKGRRNKLLRAANAKQSLKNLALKRKLEEKRLRAEINVLKHPRSIVAKRIAKNIAKRTGKVILKGAIGVNRHLDKMMAEEERRVRRKVKRKPKRKSTKKRRKKK